MNLLIWISLQLHVSNAVPTSPSLLCRTIHMRYLVRQRRRRRHRSSCISLVEVYLSNRPASHIWTLVMHVMVGKVPACRARSFIGAWPVKSDASFNDQCSDESRIIGIFTSLAVYLQLSLHSERVLRSKTPLLPATCCPLSPRTRYHVVSGRLACFQAARGASSSPPLFTILQPTLLTFQTLSVRERIPHLATLLFISAICATLTRYVASSILLTLTLLFSLRASSLLNRPCRSTHSSH